MPPSSEEKQVKPCPRCGRAILAGRDLCDVCSAETIGLPPPPSRTVQRPGCVTVFAIFLWIVSVLAVWGGITLLTNEESLADLRQMISLPGINTRTLVWLVICEAVLYSVIAIGLWHLRNWARLLVIVVQGLSLLLGVVSTCSQASLMMEEGMAPVPFLQVVVLVINGAVLAWFVRHREYFH